MALFLKKILGAFWRFLAQNVALPNSKQLDTLFTEVEEIIFFKKYIPQNQEHLLKVHGSHGLKRIPIR